MSDDDEARPRAGRLHRASDGGEVELRFVPTEDPSVFLAVTVDGEPAQIASGDSVNVDALGPGQSIAVGATDLGL